MRVRWVRCRPMGSAIVPPPVISPVDSARYSRPILRAAIAAMRALCASGVRATTKRPLVSLSSRCTRPARGSRASCGSSARSAFCRVWRALPAPGCTTSPRALSIPLAVTFQDRALLIIHKPPGLVVHPGAGNARHTLQNALLALDPQLALLPRAGLVHRLDKDTSGLLVVARTPEAHNALIAAMAARRIGREYLALSTGLMT